MNLKMRFFLTAMLALLLIAGGCKSEPKYRIGVSQCSQDDWRRKLNEEIMREALFHDDIEVEIRSADDSNDKQKEDLRYFVSHDFDIIIAAPNEADALTPLIDSIYLSGKPIIIFDRRINSDNYTSYQGADNKSIGKAAAKYSLTLHPTPKVIELEGNLETTPARDRHEGFRQYADSSRSITILTSAVAQWTQEGGRRVTDSLLRIYPEANIIYAHNDRMALGAAETISRLGRKDIKIIGIDASPEIGLKAVRDTVIQASFIYPTEGRRLIQSAIDILDGNKPEKNVLIPTLTPVDLSNAEIMLLQDEALKVETNNIKELKQRLDVYWQRHSSQTILLYVIIGVAILLSISIFMVFRSFWQQRQLRTMAERQNEQLKSQHEEIERQNGQLKQKNDEINDILHRLQQATQSKLTFFTNVSNDLRTPLTLIAEPVEQMLHADNLTENQGKLMTLADKNVKILMRLINQILDFRKYENGKLNLNLTEVNFASQLRDWTEAFQQVAARRQLKFKVEIPEEGDYKIAVDAEKIERVLFNLLSNAFKFTPAGGTVKVSLTSDENSLIFKVSDNGKGIKNEDIERIFQRFFKTEKVNPQGSGIGLALSKAFVELHGGSIEAESVEGKGSVFTVRLPWRHVEEGEESSAASPTYASELAEVKIEETVPSESEETILIIDDNPDIRSLVSTLLSPRFTVLQASDGVSGIRTATCNVPDLVICDVMMPGIDGFETCRRLKEEVTTSHIPVLLLTACSMDEQKITGYESGADAYLSKPFNSRLLLSQIESLLANRKRLKNIYSPDDPAQITAPDSPKEKKEKEGKKRDLDNDFYMRFLKAVNDNLSNAELSVDDLADALGISRVQLYRKIKALTNFSPTDLLRNIRLQTAARMLKTSDVTVAEVGFAVGFASHSYFTKCYHKYFGESPSDSQRRTSKPR